MRWGGVIIFCYVIYHLLDLTFGRVHPSFVAGDVYHNVVASLRRWPVSLAYIVAVAAVGLHVDHGLWSACQTLGPNRSPTAGWRRGLAGAPARLITPGHLPIPPPLLRRVVRLALSS